MVFGSEVGIELELQDQPGTAAAEGARMEDERVLREARAGTARDRHEPVLAVEPLELVCRAATVSDNCCRKVRRL